MIKPNFFIVGAPKSGTSSLYVYLKDHPLIFMPWLKEPFYFLTDHPGMQAVKTLEDYLALFRTGESAQYLAVGEASTLYLGSTTALESIHSYNRRARIVVLLRNPVDLVYAFHAQLLYSYDEDEPDFTRAWQLQESRGKGRKIPPKCRDAFYLQYARIGQLGRQAQQLLKIFPREQVHFLLFDDFRTATKAVYDEVLTFLGVPDDGRTEFPRYNANKRHRSKWLGMQLMKPPRFLLSLRNMMKLQDTGVIRLLKRFNAATKPRPAFDPDIRDELAETFRDDIELLAVIIDRDLSHWI